MPQNGVVVTPATLTLATGGSAVFSARLENGQDTSVVWSVLEAAGGTIDTEGRYVAPASSGVFHVVATSEADPTHQGGATVTVVAPTPSDLVPGRWTEITPAGADREWAAFVAVDPSHPSTVYYAVGEQGLWRSDDSGSTWELLGDGDYGDGESTITHLHTPVTVAIDPHDSNHLYATSGVRGANLGFWISNDRGETWRQPAYFRGSVPTIDLTSMSVDPADFDHVVVGSHDDSGVVLESRDGGETWTEHHPPGLGAGSFGLAILHHPESGVGDGDTWLVIGGGFYRTTNAGGSWQHVDDAESNHGGPNVIYTSDGTLYAGSFNGLRRSRDNGATWESTNFDAAIDGPGYDGERIWAHPGHGYNAGSEPQHYETSTDGNTWTTYTGGGSPGIANQPYVMAFDPVNRILYGAHWSSGLWALRLAD